MKKEPWEPRVAELLRSLVVEFDGDYYEVTRAVADFAKADSEESHFSDHKTYCLKASVILENAAYEIKELPQ